MVEVANYNYRGAANLILLCVQPAKLQADLVYEALGTDEAFPHLYGPLELDAVVNVVDFPPRVGGRFQLPTAISSSVTP